MSRKRKKRARSEKGESPDATRREGRTPEKSLQPLKRGPTFVVSRLVEKRSISLAILTKGGETFFQRGGRIHKTSYSLLEKRGDGRENSLGKEGTAKGLIQEGRDGYPNFIRKKRKDQSTNGGRRSKQGKTS